MEPLEELKVTDIDDIDDLVLEFGEWQKDTLDTWRENCELKEKLYSLNTFIEEKNASEKSLLAELQELRTVINSLQQMLSKRCDLDDENRKLNTTIKDLEEKQKTKEEDHQKEIELHIKDKEIAQKNFKSDLELQKSDLICRGKEQVDQLKDKLEKKEQETADLYEQVKHIEEEKCAEAMRLRTEYDKRLQRYQKHAAKSQTVQNGTLNQEIFRKKLQHMKTESDREISSLKRTISELQQQLSSYQQRTESENSFPKLKRHRKI